MRRRLVSSVAVLGVLAAIIVPTTVATAASTAPGGPGTPAWYQPSDKTGFGTAYGSQSSRVWYTLESGRLSEIYYPNLSTAASNELDFIVVDAAGHASRVSDSTIQQTTLVDPKTLEYRTVDTALDGSWRVTQTYVTDVAAPTVAVDVTFESLDHIARTLYAFYDPSLSDNGDDDQAVASSATGLAYDGTSATAFMATPALAQVAVGYVGVSDGWTDLKNDGIQNFRYTQAVYADGGNVAITAKTALDGTGVTHGTFYIGFDSVAGGKGAGAVKAVKSSAQTGFAVLESANASTWRDYMSTLAPAPTSLTTDVEKNTYWSSVMDLAASEDKTHPGAFIASPSMPWLYGQPNSSNYPSGYHMVWPRDLYNIATGLIADGDVSGAKRAMTFLWSQLQDYDGLFPQFMWVDGTSRGSGIQLDQTAFPILLAWQLHQTDKNTWTHVAAATNALINFRDRNSGLTAPATMQERWEEQPGYSPSTIASEIAALVAAADIAFSTHHMLIGLRYRAIASKWAKQLDSWTVTTNGPLSADPYFVRLTPNGKPNDSTKYNVGNTGGFHDQRTVVDAGFLELVRLGIRKASDPIIINSLKVVDASIGFPANNPMYWHRYTYDGYGETESGAAWNIPATTSYGRVWPLLTGERGEYELLAGNDPAPYLATMASSATEGGVLSEQVWDGRSPSGATPFPTGKPTTSAAPLEWTHAQYIRLAVDAAAGSVTERPLVVCQWFRTCK